VGIDMGAKILRGLPLKLLLQKFWGIMKAICSLPVIMFRPANLTIRSSSFIPDKNVRTDLAGQ